MGETCGRFGEMKKGHIALVGKPELKKPHRKPRRRQEDNIKVNFIEIGWESVS
jgi:hypothetical protein